MIFHTRWGCTEAKKSMVKGFRPRTSRAVFTSLRWNVSFHHPKWWKNINSQLKMTIHVDMYQGTLRVKEVNYASLHRLKRPKNLKPFWLLESISFYTRWQCTEAKNEWWKALDLGHQGQYLHHLEKMSHFTAMSDEKT